MGNLALTVLLLPHWNADPDREFAVNKQLLERPSDNIQKDTLESIRIVKDFLIQSGFLESIEVTVHMIDACKCSYSLYKKYLEDKKQGESNRQKTKEEEI